MPDTQLAAGRVGPAKTHHSDGKGKEDIKNNTNNNGNTASSEICTVDNLFFLAVRTWMRIMKLEEHFFFFPQDLKNCCLVLKDYIQCGSDPTASARTQWWRPPRAGRKRHLSGEAGGQAGGRSFTGPRAESPGPSCVDRLRRSDRPLASC